MGPNLPVFILSPGSVIHEGRGDREALVFDDWLVLHFTDPDQLASLAIVAQEAEASLRQSLGFLRCECCGDWTKESLQPLTSLTHGDTLDACPNCLALATGRAA